MTFSLFEELSGLPSITYISLGLAAALIAVLVVALVRARRSAADLDETQKGFSTQSLVYGAMCVALSFLLSYLKLFELPQGGSITVCSILPVCLYAYWFGWKPGLLAGFVFGLLQFLQEPIAIHPVQPFLDYLFAFACLGLAGLFRKSLPLGIAVGGIGRILFSLVSGAVFFAEYAPEGMNPWIYSFGYQMISLGPDALICVVVAALPVMKRLFERLRPRVIAGKKRMVNV